MINFFIVSDNTWNNPSSKKRRRFPFEFPQGNTNLCSGERPFAISVVDVLKIPADTKPGEYVLGWRWDVEETAQVWTSCSDITIV
eukprot:COSAG06_NODE_3606_length_5130_cov_11.552878_8_plen_85_part_00